MEITTEVMPQISENFVEYSLGFIYDEKKKSKKPQSERLSSGNIDEIMRATIRRASPAVNKAFGTNGRFCHTYLTGTVESVIFDFADSHWSLATKVLGDFWLCNAEVFGFYDRSDLKNREAFLKRQREAIGNAASGVDRLLDEGYKGEDTIWEAFRRFMNFDTFKELFVPRFDVALTNYSKMFSGEMDRMTKNIVLGALPKVISRLTIETFIEIVHKSAADDIYRKSRP